MTTRAFVDKAELFDWLRGCVRRRENVILKVVTDLQKDAIILRLSDGRLVYVNCEGRSPLDALVILTECEQVRFTYASARASERPELMSPEAFLKWLDTAGDGAPNVDDAVDVDADSSDGAADRDRWSGTLRGRRSRKGSAAVLVAAAVAASVVLAVGLYLASGDAGPDPDAGSDAELVRDSISESATWRAGQIYRLDGLVFVEGGARLDIEPGVTVLGGPHAALVVTRDGSISARGSADEPIVFTSAKPEGKRASGDWGGVVLLGNAPINRGEARIEGTVESGSRGVFGGDDRTASCGVLEYVRIEFAGGSVGTSDELSGLTLGGCGKGTLVHHVQVHRVHDDGVEILGGTVDLKHVLVTHAHDDSFDWDMGWTGRAQFLIVQQHPEIGENGLEGDNRKDNPEAQPISRPRIYNVTIVGSGNLNRNQRAMVIRNGSGGEFHNFLITGFPLESIDLRGELTAKRIASKALAFSNMVMVKSSPDGQSYFAYESGATDDDGGFDERRYFTAIASNIFLDASEALGPDAWNLTSPNFSPVSSYVGAGSNKLPPIDEEFWDLTASYYGAVRYGERANWTHGWTAYPDR